MNKEQNSVAEFHTAFGVTRHGTPTLTDEKTQRLRISLIAEELQELIKAYGFTWKNYESLTQLIAYNIRKSNPGNIVDVADAEGDLLYVVYGSGVTDGIDLEPVFAEIHKSNMSKGNPQVLRADNGKILKGRNWAPPNIKPLLDVQNEL